MKKVFMWATLMLALAGCENKELLQCQEQRSQLDAELMALEEKLAVSLSANETFKVESRDKVSRLEEKLKGQKEIYLNLEQSKKQSEAALNEQLAALKKDLKTAADSAVLLQQSIDSLNQELSQAKGQNDQVSKSNVELQNKLNVSQGQITELNAQIEQLQKQNAELVAKVKDLETILSELKSSK